MKIAYVVEGGGCDGALGRGIKRMGSIRWSTKLVFFLFYNFIPVYIFVIFQNSVPVQGQMLLRPGTYGDRCSITNPCEKNSNLQCVNNFCQCSGSNEVFDEVRERCAVQEGKRCTPPPFQHGEYNPCVYNSYCSVEKKSCVCAKHTFPDGKGHCLKKRFFNETCTVDKQCDESKYLSCVDGLCLCGNDGLFDDYYQICKRKVGDFCLRTRDCVKNSECVDAKCVCKERYTENSDKTCGLSFGQQCTGSQDEYPCSDTYFACINGMCQCKNPSYEMYDRRSKSCLSLVGGLCHLFMSNSRQIALKSCVPNGVCVRRESSALSQCECEKGFVETVSGMCQLPFGSICEKDTERFGDALAPRCDENVPLVCRKNRCDCESDHDVFDPTDKTCRRMVGAPCSERAPCVPNAECHGGRCRCGSGFRNFRPGICDEDNQILPQQHMYNVISPPPSYTMYRSTPIFE